MQKALINKQFILQLNWIINDWREKKKALIEWSSISHIMRSSPSMYLLKTLSCSDLPVLTKSSVLYHVKLTVTMYSKLRSTNCIYLIIYIAKYKPKLQITLLSM